MLRKMQWVGIIVAGLALAACGGGGDGGQASADVGAKLAGAKFATVDISKCEQPNSVYHLEGGQCIARFAGIDVKPPPAQSMAAAKSNGAQAPQSAQVPYTVPTMSALFDWAPGAYPSVFYGGYQDGNIYMPGFGDFSYRYFFSGNYLAVLGSSVYAYGWATDYTIYYVGALSDFSCFVYSCGGGGGGGGGGSTGSSLSPGSYVSSSFYTVGGYVDHSIYLYAGSQYTFSLVGNGALDPYLYLYNPSGSLLTSDDDGGDGLSSLITYTVTSTGYHTLRAAGAVSTYGSYTLYASTAAGGGGGGGGGGSTGSSLSPGSYVSSAFYSVGGYVDHSIYLYAGSQYTFSLVGSGALDPYLYLYNPSGSLLTSDDDSGDGLSSLITYTATSTGYHTLRASGAVSTYGSYTLYASTGAGGGGGGGGGSGSYITWTNSDNGERVVDANNEYFRFVSSSRCLYSENTGGITSNFCLYSGSSSGSFAGQSVQVLLVAAVGGGCIAALADPYGYQIDIYTSGGVQTVTTTNSMYNTSGCTY